MVAFQLVSKLRRSCRKVGEMPRVLVPGDRNVLVDQSKDDYLEPVFRNLCTRSAAAEHSEPAHPFRPVPVTRQ
ncbi:hypothetical protein [Streptomyces sp. NBC_00704]|uniref:hypothetical protein n=1 Tax=Streptomyces sp. NBC_00704 TaxID=2975809 RepID=UPI003FA6AAA0